MNDNYNQIKKGLGVNKVIENEPLSKYSTFRIGGCADLFYKAQTTEDLIRAVITARKYNVQIFIIGGGTNLLISESGFQGLVIKNETTNIKIIGIRGNNRLKTKLLKIHTVFLEVDSGVSVNRLVRFALDQSLAGLEPFLGQPGSIGGAIYMNAHNMKMNKFIGDAIISAKIFTSQNKIIEVSNSYFKFGYDQSIIQKTKDIVLSSIFRLKTGNQRDLWNQAQLSLDYRQQTQPGSVYSSGCIFKNISKSDAIRLATPQYTRSAGYIIDVLGLKGKKIGNAMYATLHGNFIVHQGKAKASEIIALINLAKKKAQEKYLLNLQEEIILLGKF